MALDLVIENWTNNGLSSASARDWCSNNLPAAAWTLVNVGQNRTWLRLYNHDDLVLLILSVDLGQYRVHEDLI